MAAPRDQPMMDTAETVHISSLALLKVRRDDSIALPASRRWFNRCSSMVVLASPWK